MEEKLFRHTLELVMWGLLDIYIEQLYTNQENIPFE